MVISLKSQDFLQLPRNRLGFLDAVRGWRGNSRGSSTMTTPSRAVSWLPRIAGSAAPVGHIQYLPKPRLQFIQPLAERAPPPLRQRDPVRHGHVAAQDRLHTGRGVATQDDGVHLVVKHDAAAVEVGRTDCAPHPIDGRQLRVQHRVFDLVDLRARLQQSRRRRRVRHRRPPGRPNGSA